MSQDTLTISLTNARPVRIKKDAWPIVAEASAKDWDNQYEFQANRTEKLRIVVRQHEDGRAIVYYVYDYSSAWADERDAGFRGGCRVEAGGDIEAAILRMGREASERDGAWYFFEPGKFRELAQKCIADLPAVELD